MLGKKGMSPLIVTIMLIALAVALGAMIMNWSSDVVISAQGACNNVEITPQMAFGTELICFDSQENVIRVVVRNTGTATLNSVVYRRITSEFEVRDLSMPDSRLRQGQVYEGTISHQSGQRVYLELIPEIIHGDEPVLCTGSAIIREELPSCPES